MILGDRKIVLARELTKKFEEFLRGTIKDAIEWADENESRGEFCIIIEGNQNGQADEVEDAYWTSFSVVEHIDYLINEKELNSKDAIKEVAKIRGLAKRDVYQQYHK